VSLFFYLFTYTIDLCP